MVADPGAIDREGAGAASEVVVAEADGLVRLDHPRAARQELPPDVPAEPMLVAPGSLGGSFG